MKRRLATDIDGYLLRSLFLLEFKAYFDDAGLNLSC